MTFFKIKMFKLFNIILCRSPNGTCKDSFIRKSQQPQGSYYFDIFAALYGHVNEKRTKFAKIIKQWGVKMYVGQLPFQEI